MIVDGGRPITLRTKSIVIQKNGELHIGSESRPYISHLDIVLYGHSSDPGQHPIFGNKYIGVMSTGTLEIHGQWKRSWTFLEATVQPGMCKIITISYSSALDIFIYLNIVDNYKQTKK